MLEALASYGKNNMIYALIIAYIAIAGRLSGSGFGSRWGAPWIPEALFAHAIGTALGYALAPHIGPNWATLAGCIAWGWSYGFMQSGTWMFLKWVKHFPNLERKATLKPITDWIANRFGYKLGDEGYSWIAAGIKGFLIGLPIGGIPLMILWPLGYEIGSHSKWKKDVVREVAAGVGAGLSICLFLYIVK